MDRTAEPKPGNPEPAKKETGSKDRKPKQAATSAEKEAKSVSLAISKDLAVSERGFLFDPRTGLTYTLNPTGAFILQRLQKGSTQDALVADMAAHFETTPDRASEDLRDFMQQLKDFGLGT